MLNCSVCGLAAETIKGNYEFRESGLSHVTLRGIDLIRCPHCGNIDPMIPNIKGLMKIIARTVATKPSRLTGAEIRFLRKSLELTGEQLGAIMSTDKTVISKWENESQPIGEPSERLLRAVVLLAQTECSGAIRQFAEIRSLKRPVESAIDVDAAAMSASYHAA